MGRQPSARIKEGNLMREKVVNLAVYLVGFVEEIAIFIRYGVADADSPSIFHLMKEEKKIRDSGSLIP